MAYIKDDDAAARLAVAIFAQAASDALRGSRQAAQWLTLNDIPPSAWRAVSRVSAVPKMTQPRRGRRVA